VDDVAVVATVDSAFVAMARGYLARADPNVPPVAWLIAVYVDPRWRGWGVGRAVSAGVVDWARGRGAPEVLLHVGDWNDRARRVYEELGFTPTGVRTTLAHDPSVPESEMRLRLAP
jgi:GNAT superfamily N-acetyltransferase